MWKIEYRRYRLPFRQTVRSAHGPWVAREGLLIRAEPLDSPGLPVGWGEAAPIEWFGTESPAEAETALAGLEGRAENLADALSRVPEAWRATRAGLAAALGGVTPAPGRLEDVAFLPVAGLLPAGRAALAAVGERVEMGFRVFKWKVGVEPAAEEWAVLDDLLARLPSGAKLRLDANGAWDRRTAERWLERAAERPIEYVEQPCFAGPGSSSTERRRAEDLLRGLAADFPVPLALDESVSSADDVARWLADGWSGIWVLKPALLGEPGPILARLAALRAEVVFGSALETAVGARGALELAFAWAEARGGGLTERRALGFGVWPLFIDPRADAALRGPFVRREDLLRIDPVLLWDSLA